MTIESRMLVTEDIAQLVAKEGGLPYPASRSAGEVRMPVYPIIDLGRFDECVQIYLEGRIQRPAGISPTGVMPPLSTNSRLSAISRCRSDAY